MNFAGVYSKQKRPFGGRFPHARKSVTTLARATFILALTVCASIKAVHAAPQTAPPFDSAPKPHLSELLVPENCLSLEKLAVLLDYRSDVPILNTPEQKQSISDMTASIPDLRFDGSPQRTRPATLTPPEMDAGDESDADDRPAPAMIVGIASMYNPMNAADKDAGGIETASGELYDAEGWTAAIRLDLRARFGGVRYGRNYRTTYALVEASDKRAIVKINDVGPLRPGRIIDFNERTMRFFDPSLTLGLIQGIRVTPLAGAGWTAGPLANGDDRIVNIAGLHAW